MMVHESADEHSALFDVLWVLLDGVGVSDIAMYGGIVCTSMIGCITYEWIL